MIINLTLILLSVGWTDWLGPMRIVRGLGFNIGKIEFGEESVIDDFF